MKTTQRRWVKLWHEILSDPDFQDMNLEQQARYYHLVVFTSAHGSKGKLEVNSPARKLCHLMQCNNIILLKKELKRLAEVMENLSFKENESNDGFSVTFRKWYKYQVDDSTRRVAQYRAKVTVQEEEKDKEKDKEKDIKQKQAPTPAKMSEEEWLKYVKANPAYQGIDVYHVKAKMEAWCLTHGKKPTQRRLLNWMNREDRPLKSQGEKGENAGKTTKPGKYDRVSGHRTG